MCFSGILQFERIGPRFSSYKWASCLSLMTWAALSAVLTTAQQGTPLQINNCFLLFCTNSEWRHGALLFIKQGLCTGVTKGLSRNCLYISPDLTSHGCSYRSLHRFSSLSSGGGSRVQPLPSRPQPLFRKRLFFKKLSEASAGGVKGSESLHWPEQTWAEGIHGSVRFQQNINLHSCLPPSLQAQNKQGKTFNVLHVTFPALTPLSHTQKIGTKSGNSKADHE